MYPQLKIFQLLEVSARNIQIVNIKSALFPFSLTCGCFSMFPPPKELGFLGMFFACTKILEKGVRSKNPNRPEKIMERAKGQVHCEESTACAFEVNGCFISGIFPANFWWLYISSSFSFDPIWTSAERGAHVRSFKGKKSPLLVVRWVNSWWRVIGKKVRMMNNCCDSHFFRGWPFSSSSNGFSASSRRKTKRRFCSVSLLSSYQGSTNHQTTAIANAMRPKPRAKEKLKKKMWDWGPCFFSDCYPCQNELPMSVEYIFFIGLKNNSNMFQYVP